MSIKNVKVIILALIVIGFQACGEIPVNQGFTETDISTPEQNSGIQQGLCDEINRGEVKPSAWSSDSRSPCRAK